SPPSELAAEAPAAAKVQASRVGGEADAKRRLDGLDDEPVHHLERRRDDAGTDDARHRFARGVDRVEDGEERPVRLRGADEAEDRAGDDAERALGTDREARQVVAGP